MEVILLESFDKLGGIGDVVIVKDGFARNFLIPQKKALRANKENKEYFTKIKNELLEKNKKIINDANDIIKKIANEQLVFIRNASDNGQLYGSVTPRDISNYFIEKKLNIKSSNINLHNAIKKIGIYDINIKLHTDVSCNLKLNVATSNEKAKIQKEEEENSKKTDKNKLINSSKKISVTKQESQLKSKNTKEDKKSGKEKNKKAEINDLENTTQKSDKIVKIDKKKLNKEEPSNKDIKLKSNKDSQSKTNNLDLKSKQSKK